jgi:diaminohydroxyphosphoribosylaminopyrimidine deaminase/5-amino-6-(5-phosphoribosylamino)uracil reductase
VIVGRGWTQAGGRPHAETEALSRAGSKAAGATLFVTLEPCAHHGRTPPCVDAIIAGGIRRVVSALEDPNPLVAGAGHARLRDAGVIVDVGIGAQEARRAHAGHIRRMRDGRPHVMLKLAVSADGKVGLAGRRPAVITGAAARACVHRLRATSDAVITGIGTALADDPLLTCRLPGMAAHSPVRVILDTLLRLPRPSTLVATNAETPVWIIAGMEAPVGNEAALRSWGVDVLRVPAAHRRVDLAAALRLLAKRGITRVMVESGPIVATSLLKADLVDEVRLFRSSVGIGADGIDALDGLPLSAVTDTPRFASRGTQSIGADTVETFERAE